VADQSPPLGNLFDVVKVSDVETSVATTAAKIFQRLEIQGNRIGLRDTFIGATAMEEGVPVYTQNPDRFNRIQGLNVIAP
jgi:predicted nucleic acid-binding protein